MSVPRRLRLPAVLLAGLLAACEVPSAPPILQQTWAVPGDSSGIGVTELLPTGVQVSGGSFTATTQPGTMSSTLAQLCGQPACQSATTVSAPVPAFSGSLQQGIGFPSGVTNVTVSGGTLTLAIANTLGFDPLRPNGAAAPYGSAAVLVSSGATSRTQTFDGSTQAMPTGQTTTLSVALPTGAYTGSLTVMITFTVPAGGTASLRGSNAVAVTATVQGLTASSATVGLLNKPFSVAPTAFDLADVDFSDIVAGGELALRITNPLMAQAAATLTLSAPAQGTSGAVSITKPLPIPAGATQTTTIALTAAELRSLLGKTGVTIGLAGTATGLGSGSTVTVTPTQRIAVKSTIRLLLNAGA